MLELLCLACLGKATAVNKERAMQGECMTDHVTIFRVTCPNKDDPQVPVTFSCSSVSC